MRKRLPGAITAVFILALLSAVVSCSPPPQDFNTRLDEIVDPHRFSILEWEISMLSSELEQKLAGYYEGGDGGETALRYFACTWEITALEQSLRTAPGNASIQAEVERLKAERESLKGKVEHIIAAQLQAVVGEHGIHNPFLNIGVDLPRINFRLQKPPNVLVISPRSKIELTTAVTLDPGLPTGEFGSVETRVDSLNVSSLIVEPGGFGGTYPSMISEDNSLEYTVQVACMEWTHQFLIFKPLGFLYLLHILGIRNDYEIYVMDETFADLFAAEVTGLVLDKYYLEQSGARAPVIKLAANGFDFNQEMRNIRRAVDEYLAQGQVELAESYMEERRLYLQTKGYYIRKLNQAYFAFNDSYPQGDAAAHFAPGYYATLTNGSFQGTPIEADLKKVRSQCATLKEYLDRVGAMTSREQLRQAAAGSS